MVNGCLTLYLAKVKTDRQLCYILKWIPAIWFYKQSNTGCLKTLTNYTATVAIEKPTPSLGLETVGALADCDTNLV